MNGEILQSALRELKIFAASRNLWLTFGAVVLIFAITGPFGTMERLPLLPRLAFWFSLHLLAWATAIVFAVLGDALLVRMLAGQLRRMMIGAALASIPIGLIIRFINFAWFGEPMAWSSLSVEIAAALPLCLIFCGISYLTMSGPGKHTATALEDMMDDAPPQPIRTIEAAMPGMPLLRRLKPENRGTLQHISVEDHYTVVRTSRGRELVLLRFSDALAETGTSNGLQVHRSHWVADDFVETVNRADGKLSLLLRDGTEIPVSRTYAAMVRARFS